MPYAVVIIEVELSADQLAAFQALAAKLDAATGDPPESYTASEAVALAINLDHLPVLTMQRTSGWSASPEAGWSSSDDTD